jgi:hypothetical protein
MSAKKQHKSGTEVGFHQGHVLLRLAETYSTLQDVIRELIQNALDANAKKVWVEIDLATHRVAVRDNGDGASQKDIDAAMAQIGLSQKAPGKLGRFGIGSIAAVGQCLAYYLTSCTKESGAIFRTWTLIRADIEKTAENLIFPVRERRELSGRHKAGIPWRTEALMTDVTKDSQLSRIDLNTLRSQILSNFGQVLKRTRAVIEVKFTDATGREHEALNIRYTRATGMRMDAYTVRLGNVTTRCDLIRVNRSPDGYRGEVKFGESGDYSGFRITLSQFIRYSAGKHLSEEAKAALKSGLFDGDIVADAIELTASRQGFKSNDALKHFCFAINKWAEEVAKQLMDEVRDEKLELRRQLNGEAAMASLKQRLFGDNRFADVLSMLLGRSTFGTQGSGHAPTPGKDAGEQEDRSRRVDGQPREPGKKKHSRRESGGSQTPREPDAPTTVVGPEGTRRKVVRDDSLGLQFSFYPNTSDRIWELIPDEGRLNFNAAHPGWATCEDHSDATVRQLIETVTIHALSAYALDSDDWMFWREPLDKALEMLIASWTFKQPNHLRSVKAAS